MFLVNASSSVLRRSVLTWLLALVLSTVLAPAWSQEQKRRDADPSRFESAIAAFERADRENPPPSGTTLFVGASNIRRWTSVAERFNQPVLNRGFGGAHLSDVLHFADRIVIPYAPKTIYLNAGGNDLHHGRTPEQVASDFQSFVEKIRHALPEARLAFLSIPPSPSRWSEVEQVRETNQRIAELAKRDGKTEIVDIFSRLLDEHGLPRAECYVDDRLHFSERGYDVVTSTIRWHHAVSEIESRSERSPPPEKPILFIGSSSIVRWKSLADDFPDLPVVNHGFGGSDVFDSLNYLDRLVLPWKPRLVVMYAGSNDIHRGKPPERVAGDFREFVERIHARLPDTRIAYISIAGNPARWSEVEQVRAANSRIEAYIRTDPRLTFINVFPHMLGDDGLPKPDIFVADRLHMNENGYAIWKDIVGPVLRQAATGTR